MTAMLARNEFPGETMILSLFKLMLVRIIVTQLVPFF
jgi:hypothetical protein